jgi:hypothetical protein
MPNLEMEKRIFSGAEKVTMAERIGEIGKDVSLLEDEIKNIKSKYKSQIDTLKTEAKDLIWKIHDGYEMIYPEQGDLPGFTEGDADELTGAIGGDESASTRDNKRLKKAFKGILVKVPTISVIAGWSDEEFENALAWAENPEMFDKPAFLGD